MVKARNAAAAIIVDGTETNFEVLLARRNQAIQFMGGHHVFPGGAIDTEDDPAYVEGAPDEATGRAMAAAVREVFEETGLLYVRAGLPDIAQRRAWRRALVAGEMTFPEVLDALGTRIHAADLTPAGVWLTPQWAPKRFFTRYFMIHHTGPRYEEVLDAEGEIVGLDWLHPAEARRRWHNHELRLSTPVAFVLRYLAGLPLEEAMPWLHKSPHQAGVPDLFEPRRGIHIVPLRTRTLPPANRTNCIIVGEGELAVVDPGASDPEEQARLKKHLDDMAALGSRVACVLLTHAHGDHASAAGYLREQFGAPVWGHARCAERLDVPLDRALAEGDEIPLHSGGWHIRCLHTPGHDPAHLCYHETTTNTLMVGDMVANPGTVLISPELGGDMTVYLEQLRRLAEVHFGFLIPGHGLPLNGENGRDYIRALIAHRHEREAKIRTALAAGHRSMEALLEEAYADTARALWPLATQQLQAHLVRLGIDLKERN